MPKPSMRKKIDELADLTEAQLLVLDGYDDCIIGASLDQFERKQVVVYDYWKIIGKLRKDGMGQEEAEEYFDFNIIGGWLGDLTPLFVDTLGGAYGSVRKS